VKGTSDGGFLFDLSSRQRISEKQAEQWGAQCGTRELDGHGQQKFRRMNMLIILLIGNDFIAFLPGISG
jgi:hypothetical protein